MSIDEIIFQIKNRQNKAGYYSYLNLMNQDLSEAEFKGLDLSYVLFRSCNLRGTIFSECKFRNSDFAECTVDELTLFSYCMIDEPTMISLFAVENGRINSILCENGSRCVLFKMPLNMDGEFIGYKIVVDDNNDPVLVTLKIPADAYYFAFINEKCRANKATVVKMEKLNGTPLPDDTIGYSAFYMNKSIYYKGMTVIADGFDPRPSEECTRGIHFFLSKEEAIHYVDRYLH